MKPEPIEKRIVYEDRDILVVDKPRDLLTIRTQDKATFSHNLYHYLHQYLAKKGESLYLVHRLDYETSGIMIFAKSGQWKEILQTEFEERRVKRIYEAVVEEKLPLGEAHHVEQYLKISPHGVAISEEKEGKLAITDFVSHNPIQIGTALEVSISTGRRNQIRMALAHEGLHLIGDERYAKNKAKRMYLNALELDFDEGIGLRKSSFRLTPLWLTD